MNSWRSAFLAAWRIWRSEASRSPYLMFSRRVTEKRSPSWLTMPICRRRDSRRILRMSLPSRRTEPSINEKSDISSAAVVALFIERYFQNSPFENLEELIGEESQYSEHDVLMHLCMTPYSYLPA